MSVGQLGASATTESTTISPNNSISATDSVVDARRTFGGAGNIKIGKKGSLTINQSGGLTNDDLKNALAPLTNIQLAQSNFRPAEVQNAIDTATAGQITRLEDDRQQLSVANVKKYGLWLVAAIIVAAIGSVILNLRKKK